MIGDREKAEIEAQNTRLRKENADLRVMLSNMSARIMSMHGIQERAITDAKYARQFLERARG